jgi:HSP20 family protein
MFDLARWEPFDGLNLINNFLEDTWQRPQQAQPAVWYPPVDILESKDSYLIRAELPGMSREDFNLELKEGVLTLSGERKAEQPAEGVEYHRSERLAGKFSRSFHLPQTVAQDGIKATYRDGILEVYVPKAEEIKPRKITVNVN